MPFIYSQAGSKLPADAAFKGKDLGVTVDIGGDQQTKNLRPDEEMAKKFGAAITDTIQTGVSIGSKLPIVAPVVGAIADSPIGTIVGEGLKLLSIPSNIVSGVAARVRLGVTGKESLPDDIRRMLDSGASVDQVADYMVNSQRAFSDDAEANLLFTMITDPLNFTPLVFSKVNAISALGKLGKFGSAATGALAGASMGPAGALGGAYGGWKAASAVAGKVTAARGTAMELAKTGAEMSNTQILMQTLNRLDKPVGLDLTKRLASGSRLIEESATLSDDLAKVEKDLAKDPNSPILIERRLQLKEDMKNSVTSASINKAITNSFGLGVYRGLVGAKNVAASGVKGLSAALGIPAQMTVPLKFGGQRFNDVIDQEGALLGANGAEEMGVMAGQGAAHIVTIAAARLIAAPQIALADSVASVTMASYQRALADLVGRSVSGTGAVPDVDNIVGTMVNNARSLDANQGVVKTFQVSDTVEGIAELKERVKIIRDFDQAALQNANRSANPQLVRLSNKIQDFYVSGELQRLGRTPGGVPKKIINILSDMGADGVARLIGEETDRLITAMTPRITSKAATKQLYIDKMITILKATGRAEGSGLSALQKSQIDDVFENLYGKYFTESGALVGDGSAAEAARDMANLDMRAYASSNKVAAKLNESLRSIMNPTNEQKAQYIATLGKNGFAQLQASARLLGPNGVQLVRNNFLFETTARSMSHVWKKIEEISADGRARSGNSDVVLREQLDQPLVREYVGNAADVADVVRFISTDVIAVARKSGDARLQKLGRDYLKAIRKAKNMQDVRKAWVEISLESSDDLRSTFGTNPNPTSIARYLDEAVKQGWATAELSRGEVQAVRNIMKAAGMDPELIERFTGSGYTLAKSPQAAFHRVSQLVENPNIDAATKRFAWESRVSPYVDMTSPYLQDIGNLAPRYAASKIQEFYSSLFQPITTATVTSNIRKRMAAYLARGGVSQGHINSLMDELVAKSMEDGISARGLQSDKIEEAFRRSFDLHGNPGEYERFKATWAENLADPKSAEFSAVNAVMYAFEGDLNVVGLTQKITGRAKRGFPALAGLTDRFYPQYRFKMNPLYWVQEWFESDTINAARGVNSDVIQILTNEGEEYMRITGQEVKTLARIGPEAHSIVDNVSFLTVFRNKTLENAIDNQWQQMSLRDMIKSGKATEQLAYRKELRRDSLAADIASKNFADELLKNDPNLYNALVAHYKTSDPRALFVKYMDYRRRLKNVGRVLSDVDASRPAGIGFRRIPDKTGDVLREVKTDLFGGVDKNGFVINDDELFNMVFESPSSVGDNIELLHQQLIDAGYDASLFSKEFDAYRSSVRSVFELQKRNPTFGQRVAGDTFRNVSGDEELAVIGRLTGSRAELKNALLKVENYKIDASLRKQVATRLMLSTGWAEGGKLSEEGIRIAEALALGHSYGPEIAEVTNLIDTVVDQAKRAIGTGSRIAPENQAVLTQIVSEGANIILKDEKLIQALNDASYSLITNHGHEERIYRAFEHVYEKALKQANTSTYFNSERSLFERSINHPFLGFYPYSYMFHKVLPEMINFLFKKPFGVAAPGAGFEAYKHVRDYVEQQIETDYTFKKYLEDNNEVAFLITQLFPGVPWDLSVMPPNYVRAITGLMSGRDKNLTLDDMITRGFVEPLSNVGPLGAIKSVSGSAQQIVDEYSGANKPKPAAYGINPLPDFNIYGGKK